MIINTHCHMTTLGDDFSYEMGRKYEANYARKHKINWWTGKPWTAQDFCVTPEKLISDMDRGGVDKAVVMGYHMTPKPNMVEYMEQMMTDYPGRIVSLLAVDPVGGLQSVRKIEDAIKNHGLRGVKMLPGYCDPPVANNDRRIWPIYEIAQDLDVPVLVHCGSSSLQHSFDHIHNDPFLLEEVAYAFPKLKIIAAHTGMNLYDRGLTLLSKYENMYSDFAFWGGMPKFKIAETLVWAKQMHVLEKIMWGSDYPEFDFAPEIEMYRGMPEYTRRHDLEPYLTDEDIDGFLGNNAAKLFKL